MKAIKEMEDWAATPHENEKHEASVEMTAESAFVHYIDRLCDALSMYYADGVFESVCTEEKAQHE